MSEDVEEKDEDYDDGQYDKDVTLLHELTRHPGWAIFVRMIETQVESRKNYVIQKRGTTEDEWEKEFQKGEIAAYTHMVNLRQMLEDERRYEKGLEDDGQSSDDSYPSQFA